LRRSVENLVEMAEEDIDETALENKIKEDGYCVGWLDKWMEMRNLC
jgi:hypothetical protein